MIRLIATDLDGTLLEPNGQLPQGTYEAVKALRDLGICFAASSGRQYGNLVRLFGTVADQMAFICENGSINMVDGQEAGVVAIPSELVRLVIDDLESLGLNILVSGRHSCYMLDRNRTFTDDIVYRLRNTITILGSWDELCEPVMKISGHTPNGVHEIAPGLIEKWGSRLTATVAGKDWFDVTQANKGMGIDLLLRHLNIKPEETVAFGDNFNDESMLDAVGYPFLMEHANPALRKGNTRLCRKVLPVLRAIIDAKGDPQKAFDA